MIFMVFIKNLGYVKGDQGETFTPEIDNIGPGIYKIKWLNSDGVSISESTIETIYFFPICDSEAGKISWGSNNAEVPLPAPMTVKRGPKPIFTVNDDGDFFIQYID